MKQYLHLTQQQKEIKENIANVISQYSQEHQSFKEQPNSDIKQNKESRNMKKFISEYVSNLSIGLINIINIFEPQAISLGGSFAYYEKTLLNKLSSSLEKEEIFNKNNMPKIVLAKLKNDAGIIGATL